VGTWPSKILGAEENGKTLCDSQGYDGITTQSDWYWRVAGSGKVNRKRNRKNTSKTVEGYKTGVLTKGDPAGGNFRGYQGKNTAQVKRKAKIGYTRKWVVGDSGRMNLTRRFGDRYSLGTLKLLGGWKKRRNAGEIRMGSEESTEIPANLY